MVFDKITEDGRLWAVRFDENADNEFIKTIDQWDDVQWLRAFFIENISDLIAYFKISDINIAISDTIDDSDRLQRIILDISPEADLNRIFRPLDNNQASCTQITPAYTDAAAYTRSEDVFGDIVSIPI